MRFDTKGLEARLVRLSLPGLIWGTFFFAASLTPSMIPRHFVLQGALSGFSFALGYGLGLLLERLWAYVQLPRPGAAFVRRATLVTAAVCCVVAVIFLWLATGWQNSVRAALQLPLEASASPLFVGIVAAITFWLLRALARLIGLSFRIISRRLKQHMPERAANFLGVLLAALLCLSVLDGLIFRLALSIADSSYREFDALIETDVARPIDPLRTGSAASLLDWQHLGRAGREFIDAGPNRESIAALAGGEARQPIRVYAGLNSAATPRARAALALAELKRVGAFDRPVLVIIMPTGTGWVDPAGIDTLEYMHRGNVASVAVQYSYLSSWLSLLIEPENGSETAHALFDTVYGYWTTLPHDSRPKLYLSGLSLGALGSQRSADMFKVIGDPFNGAVWSGTPFRSTMWRTLTAGRQPGSPAWLPMSGDGSTVRFTNQQNHLAIPGAKWGPMRIVMLQYASDPITFFEPSMFWRRPEWLDPRGPDVSPALRWIPIVSALQMGVDITLSGMVPPGRGHVFAAAHYIDAWKEVTQPPGWSDADTARLKAAMAGR
ncbi:putative membrane protein [Sphingomonas naasensis]|uniref:Alpha/beta-hydrolase family protein n=1 Tax=Sphingomonas naasensis TaxID=1344951 RepID=A0A4S1WWW6_9SPHN|nr:alpha/beta-hydrolase family protein [Sphingomonas naasensis]NIJ18864.1 putative membrane protein [Sphingomonas naasensis]TGX46086.1 hypothetical protein E5A74_02660 [Sphingomonas naasensis]